MERYVKFFSYDLTATGLPGVDSEKTAYLDSVQDFPFINAAVTSADLESIMAYPGLTDEEKENLLSGNYKKLFGDKLRFS